jgi:primosomal protein N' (replication factor Y)
LEVLANTTKSIEPFVKYASVILELAIDKTLDYGITTQMLPHIRKGMLVEVKVRGTKRRAYIFDIKDKAEVAKVNGIENILYEEEVITEELFELALWMAKYYHTPLSSIIKSFLPGSIRKQIEPKQQLFITRVKSKEELKNHCIEIRNTFAHQALVLDFFLKASKGVFLSELLQELDISRSPIDTLVKKGYLKFEEVMIGKSPLMHEEYFQTKPKKLNSEQQEALEKIYHTLDLNTFQTHLIFGVTGSGKTEVYMQAISKALALGKSALMLVPEIALTTQTVERFRSRFPQDIAILHHRLSEGERYSEWHKIRAGQVKIVIGARSAVFCPLANLGLIIVDEEHENSYKQTDDNPHYHARDVAVMRGYLQKACVVLGSATPSLESFYNAQQKKYILSPLMNRAGKAQMPKVAIVDMKKEIEKAGSYTLFSEPLLKGIKSRMEIGEQSILFLNRRGYYTTQLCKACSYVTKCPHCDLNLTFHFNEKHLSCHLCGFTQLPPNMCPECKNPDSLKYKGSGTEQVERAIKAIFPTLKVLRIDADTTRHKGSHEKLLREFRTGKADLLIGTQMISKGLHFPSVTLVGVLNADSSLNIPDFRASENVFQLITQVAGRAGRGVIEGEVIIQSYLPENPTLKLAKEQDYLSFYNEEIEVRKMFNYPPLTHMIKLTFTGDDNALTFDYARRVYDALSKELPNNILMHPVVPAGYAKVKDKFRFQLVLSGPSVYFMNKLLDAALSKVVKPKDISLSIDVDPLSTFF